MNKEPYANRHKKDPSETTREKGKNMNTMKPIATFACLGATLLLVFGVTGCASTGSKPSVQVVEEKGYIPLRHVQDTSQALSLKKGDAVAMVCSKCKTVQYRLLTSPTAGFPYGGTRRQGTPGYSSWDEQRRSFENWSQRHYCPGCKSTITITGTWLNRKETVKHTCEACGEDSVFCCATEERATPTEGMEPKK